MADIRFYQTQFRTAAEATPQLLQKALAKGMKVLLKTPDHQRQAFYDDWLWRFDPGSFLPHGQEGDPMPDQHPIWITTGDRADNDATMALIVEGADLPPLDDFAMICVVFDSQNQDALEKVRQQWTSLKEGTSHQLAFWKQKEDGSWSQQER